MILISAGHHPLARGACYDGFCEYDEALKWRDEIISILGDQAVAVPTGTLPQKVKWINALDANIAIEIHFNSAIINGTHVGRGCETLYYPGSKKGKDLARTIQHAIAPIHFPDRGIKEGWYRMDKPGIVDYDGDVEGDEKPDYFLRKTNCTAIIIEPEFIHYKIEIPHKRKGTCESIAEALKGWRYGK